MPRLTYRDKVPTQDHSLIEGYFDLLIFSKGIFGPVGPDGKTKWISTNYPKELGRQDRHREVRQDEVRTAICKWVCLAMGLPTTGKLLLYGSRYADIARYGIIDLDKKSDYRRQEIVDAMLRAGQELGLDLVVCQSSASTGRWLMIWCEEYIQTEFLAELLVRLCLFAGVPAVDVTANGRVETYPSVRAPLQGVRFPGQQGWGLVEPSNIEELIFVVDPARTIDGLRTVIDLSKNRANSLEALATALCQLQEIQGDLPDSIGGAAPVTEAQEGKITVAPKADDAQRWEPLDEDLRALDIDDLDPGMVAKYDYNSVQRGRRRFQDEENSRGIWFWRVGKWLYLNGLPAPGTRDRAIQAVGFYLLFRGLCDPADRERELNAWIESKHNGNSAGWLEDPEEVRRGIHRAAFKGTTTNTVSKPHGPQDLHDDHDKEPHLPHPTDISSNGCTVRLTPAPARRQTRAQAVGNQIQHREAKHRIIRAIFKLFNDNRGDVSKITADAILAATGCNKRVLNKFHAEMGLKRRQWVNKRVLGRHVIVSVPNGRAIIRKTPFLGSGWNPSISKSCQRATRPTRFAVIGTKLAPPVQTDPSKVDWAAIARMRGRRFARAALQAMVWLKLSAEFRSEARAQRGNRG